MSFALTHAGRHELGQSESERKKDIVAFDEWSLCVGEKKAFLTVVTFIVVGPCCVLHSRFSGDDFYPFHL